MAPSSPQSRHRSARLPGQAEPSRDSAPLFREETHMAAKRAKPPARSAADGAVPVGARLPSAKAKKKKQKKTSRGK